MQIDKVLHKYQLVPLVFAQDAVAANQTDEPLFVMQAGGPVELAVTGYTMPFDGEVVGISCDLSAAATAGSLTIGPTIGGVREADPSLTVTTGTSGSDTVRVRGLAAFDAGDIIGAMVTSSADWNAETADLSVVVWVVLAVTGI